MTRSFSALSATPSTVALLAVTVAMPSQVFLVLLQEADLPANAGRFWMLMLNTAWSWWVHVDRRRLGQSYPFEFDALVFFAWPVVAPYYLVKTRRLRSWPHAVLIWSALLLPFVAEFAYAFAY